MTYINTFFDGPLAGAELRSTVQIGEIIIRTEEYRDSGKLSGMIMPVSSHAYECDSETMIDDETTIRRFTIATEDFV